MASASWMSSLRSTRSASLPQIGVEMVVVSRVAVTTQVKADWVPPRSEMIRGSDEDTTLVARIETNIPSRMPDRASRTSRWVIFGVAAMPRRSWLRECSRGRCRGGRLVVDMVVATSSGVTGGQREPVEDRSDLERRRAAGGGRHGTPLFCCSTQPYG